MNAYGVKSGWSCGWQIKTVLSRQHVQSVALRDCLGRTNALYKYLILYFTFLRLNGRDSSSLPAAAALYRSVGTGPTGVDNRLRSGIPAQYVTSHPGQLSLLPSVGREMNTVPAKERDALWLGSKGRIAHSIRGYAYGWQVKL